MSSTVSSMKRAINLKDFESIAKDCLSQPIWNYFASGANDEITLRNNREAFSQIALHYKVLVNVSECSLHTHVLGQKVCIPVLVAPLAFHKLAHPNGELATARAASAQGTIMILSTMSTTPIEEVVVNTSSPIWFQLYIHKDRAITKVLVERIEAAGCSAIVLTVDAPFMGQRERSIHSETDLFAGLQLEHMFSRNEYRTSKSIHDKSMAARFASLFDPSITWKDVEWLRSITKLPVLVKGIIRADDARRAVDCGASGIVVSNHGGRQLDTAPATIEALPNIIESVDKSVDILLDGGVLRGTDVIKALALGAKAVLIGRPILWGLAAGGAEGVKRILEILHTEVELAMSLCGCPTIADINSDLLQPQRH